MDKFLRNYQLLVGEHVRLFGKDQTVIEDPTILEIEPPFTLEFNIVRDHMASVNEATLRIYNLSETNRKKIFKDDQDFNLYIPITLRAGYGEITPVIFKGNIRRAYSVRDGTNYITTIDAFDGGDAIINGNTNRSFQKGTSIKQILAQVASDAPNVTVGAIGNFEGALKRGNSINGNTADVLKGLTNDSFFIDLQKIYCLKPEECLAGEVILINSDTGLLGTPLREKQIVHLDILFEPRVFVAQQVQLDSSTAVNITAKTTVGNNINGLYKVISINHKGTISGAVAGTAVTTLGLFGASAFKEVVGT